jgi:hypothetical protein
VFVTSVFGLAFLTRGWVFTVISLQPLLLLSSQMARLERLSDKVRAGLGVPRSSSSGRCGKKFRECSMFLHLWLLTVNSLFFGFGVGRALHNVLTSTFRGVIGNSTARFSTSNSWVCPQATYNVSVRPRPGSCLLLLPLMPLLVVISLLRRSCCSAPRSHMPLLHSGCARRLFLHVRPFEIHLAALS